MLWLNNLKTKTAMNAKISVFVICVEAIIYLLLYNLHDCTFNFFKKELLHKCFLRILLTTFFRTYVDGCFC